MIEKNKIFGIIGIVMIILMTPLIPAYNNWTIGVTYQINDIVTYNNTNYICIQAHTSQAGWTPPVVPALWNEYEEPPENGVWGVGIHYYVGDIVEFYDENYEVIQAHTSQEDWLPPEVPALYRPLTINYSIMHNFYMNINDYTILTEAEMYNKMDFKFIKSEINAVGIEYIWNFYKPTIYNNEIKWDLIPIKIVLDNDTIILCLNNYNTTQCNNILLTNEYTTIINENEIYSVWYKMQFLAYNEIQNAMELKNQIQEINNQAYYDFLKNYVFN